MIIVSLWLRTSAGCQWQWHSTKLAPQEVGVPAAEASGIADELEKQGLRVSVRTVCSILLIIATHQPLFDSCKHGQRSQSQSLLFSADIVLDCLRNMIDRNTTTQFFELRVFGHILQTDLLCDLPIHSDHGRDFFFREQENLEHEMFSFISAFGQS